MTPSTTLASTTRTARAAGARALRAPIASMRPMPMLRVVVLPPPSPGPGLPAL